MPDDETGSLDRFVRTRGVAMVNHSPTAIRWWLAAAVANAGIAAGFPLLLLTGSALVHWPILLCSAVFLGSSGAMFAVAARLRKPLSGVRGAEVRMSVEADRLLTALWDHTESGWGARVPACKTALTPAAFDLLE